MNTEIFQNVFDKLQDALIDNWKKVVFFAAYTLGSYSMKFYVDCGDGQYIDCFNISGMNKTQLIKLFRDIDKELSTERNRLDETKKWTVFTMVVDNNGVMETEFDYEDLSENMIDYECKWKKFI